MKHLPAESAQGTGLVIAGGDPLAIQGRATGWGSTPLIGVDRYRVEKGKFAEHRDAGRDEVLDIALGLPIFQPMN